MKQSVPLKMHWLWEAQTLRYNQIVAYERAGDFAKAKSLMNAYLSSYPDDEAAQREAVFLSTR